MGKDKGKAKVGDTSEGARKPHERCVTRSARFERERLSQPTRQPSPLGLPHLTGGVSQPSVRSVVGDDAAVPSGRLDLVDPFDSPASARSVSPEGLGRIADAGARAFEDATDEDDEDYTSDDSGGEDRDVTGRESVHGGDMIVRRPSQVQHHRDPRGRFIGGPGGDTGAEGSKRRRKRVRVSSSSSTGAEEWVVDRPMPGGPETADIIPSYRGHVASWIWSGVERESGVLSLYTRPGQMRSICRAYDAMSDVARGLIEDTGLQHLPSLMYADFDIPLIAAFVERWQPDTNTFHLPFGEMTIMLHDVDRILGLPAEGQLRWSSDARVAGEAVVDLFGSTSLEVLAQQKAGVAGKIVVDRLLRRCESGFSDGTRSRSWVVACIGAALFTDKSGTSIRPTMVGDADPERTRHVGWGPMTLAYLYRELGVASHPGCRGIAGCLTLLQAWIWEYFHCFRPARGGLGILHDPPRAAYWTQFEACLGARRGCWSTAGGWIC